ncbi:hypothetical protein IF2G_10914 [Cordyceps javanica]|nr:hypothetical protein IF2G_10914 [Cordyceps javanica]
MIPGPAFALLLVCVAAVAARRHRVQANLAILVCLGCRASIQPPLYRLTPGFLSLRNKPPAASIFLIQSLSCLTTCRPRLFFSPTNACLFLQVDTSAPKPSRALSTSINRLALL